LYSITASLRHCITGLLMTLACAASVSGAQGKPQTDPGAYPQRPVRFIIPYPAGGATDVLSRLVAERLAARLGQPVVGDNRGGAAGRIGLELLSKAPADGYTISLPSSGMAISVTLIPKLPYDPLRDFAPVSLVADIPAIIVTPATFPAATLKEFIALARAKPGAYLYGSGGIGATNHVTAEQFQLVAGVRLTHVPYKSAAGGLPDVISGQIQVMFIGPPAAAPHVQAGRLRALAVVYHKRFAGMPDVPTTAEAGVPGVDSPTWYAIVVPAATPKAIIERLNRELVAILNSPEMAKQLLLIGAEPRPLSPEETAAFIRREVDKWAKVIRAAGIRPE
jgi:tripartite-type tricarboxylate transporter receptor subunit TctC